MCNVVPHNLYCEWVKRVKDVPIKHCLRAQQKVVDYLVRTGSVLNVGSVSSDVVFLLLLVVQDIFKTAKNVLRWLLALLVNNI